jgi:hypothetical protein
MVMKKAEFEADFSSLEKLQRKLEILLTEN